MNFFQSLRSTFETMNSGSGIQVGQRPQPPFQKWRRGRTIHDAHGELHHPDQPAHGLELAAEEGQRVNHLQGGAQPHWVKCYYCYVKNNSHLRQSLESKIYKTDSKMKKMFSISFTTSIQSKVLLLVSQQSIKTCLRELVMPRLKPTVSYIQVRYNGSTWKITTS